MKCYAPWHSLTVRFNGDIAADCVYTARYGNILKQSLEDILSSDQSKSTKSSILNDVLPKECSQCTAKENVNGHSRRIFFNEVLNPIIPIQSNYTVDYNDIVFLEFNMSNICNLKCRMCSGVNSTAWIKEDIKLSKHSILQRPVNSPEFGYTNISEDIVDSLFEDGKYFTNLKYVNIKGGEPYLEPVNKKIMQKLISMGIARNIILDISTNGTIVDLEFDALALQFKETRWHVSIEGIGRLYEYIRGGDHFTFEQLEQNIKSFAKFDRVILAGTVMTYNVCHLIELEQWFHKIKQSNFELYLNNVVTTPSYLNPCLLPDSILQGTGYTHDNKLNHEVATFVEYTNRVDELRGTSILDVCPELNSLFS